VHVQLSRFFLLENACGYPTHRPIVPPQIAVRGGSMVIAGVELLGISRPPGLEGESL
jgi:hypothetical protein